MNGFPRGENRRKTRLRPAIAITAIGALLPFLWVFFSPLRHLREIPEAVD